MPSAEWGAWRLRPDADRHGVALGGECPRDLLVSAAPGAAKVALANILDNAVKFSPKGSAIGIAIGASQDEVFIAVSDTGPGISSEDVAGAGRAPGGTNFRGSGRTERRDVQRASAPRGFAETRKPFEESPCLEYGSVPA